MWKGSRSYFEMATDYEIDVRMVWEYFAEQLSPVRISNFWQNSGFWNGLSDVIVYHLPSNRAPFGRGPRGGHIPPSPYPAMEYSNDDLAGRSVVEIRGQEESDLLESPTNEHCKSDLELASPI